jgi:hypothetical protein
MNAEIVVNGPGTALSIAHGEDHGGGAADDVTAGENTGNAGHAVGIGLDVAPLVEFEVGTSGC